MNDAERATRMQVLALENATLLAQRSQLWSDASSRGSMFLAVLSGAVVAIALTAQATQFDSRFFAFIILLLPVVLYVGITSLGRLAELNDDDLRIIQALHRIRHGILELDPDAKPYLALGHHDDWAAISRTYADTDALAGRDAILHGLRTLPALFGVINSVVAAVLAAAIAIFFELAWPLVTLLAVIVFVVLFVLFARNGIRRIRRLQNSLEVRHPSPPRATTGATPAEPTES